MCWITSMDLWDGRGVVGVGVGWGGGRGGGRFISLGGGRHYIIYHKKRGSGSGSEFFFFFFFLYIHTPSSDVFGPFFVWTGLVSRSPRNTA